MHYSSHGCFYLTHSVDGDFSRKSQNFLTPCIFRPDEGVPLGIGYRRWDQKN